MSVDRQGSGVANQPAQVGVGGSDAPLASHVHELDGGAVGEMPRDMGLALPGPVSEAFFHDDAGVIGIQGPVGSGKTTTLIYSRLRRARMMPRSVIDGVRRYKLVAVRRTYRELWSTTIPSYLEVIPKKAPGSEWSGGRGDPVTHRVPFEDEFGPIEWVTEFLAFGDDVEQAMRGIQATDFWLSEADTMSVDVLTTAVGRIRRWPGLRHLRGYPPELQDYGQIACDFNAPEDEDNWVVPVFHDDAQRAALAQRLSGEAGGAGVSINFHRQPGGMDPGAENLQNLASGYYQLQVEINQAAGRSDKTERLVHNRIAPRRVGVPVFLREFNPRIHVAEETIRPDPDLPLRIGTDQGFTPAAVIAQFRPPLRWTVLAELMFPREHLLARVFGERVADLLDTPRFAGLEVMGGWGDMAGEHGASQADDENRTWNTVFGKAAGVRMRPQRVGSNRIQPRLEAVRAALEHIEAGRPGLLIDPSCRHLRAGFSARYVWGEEVDRTGNKRKVPDKRLVEANAMDALQYLLLSETRGDGTSAALGPRPSSALRMGRPDDGRGGLSTGWGTTDMLKGVG